jgi:hypothetical protein
MLGIRIFSAVNQRLKDSAEAIEVIEERRWWAVHGSNM